MEKKIILSLLCLILVFSAAAQVAVNIFDPFYDDLQTWENQGIINYAPNVWPLPMPEIERILNTVMEAGNKREQARAADHYQRIFKHIAHYGSSADLGLAYTDGRKRYLNLAPFLDLNYAPTKYFSLSARVGCDITNKLPDIEPLPKFTGSNRDIVNDDASIGSLKILPEFNSGMTIGNSMYYFSANIARTSYAPFHDSGIFVSKECRHHGQFTLVVNKRLISYSQSLLVLAATNEEGRDRGPEKFLNFHSLHFRPLDWISVGVSDAMIVGGRFEPIYLIPASVFFVSQALFAFPDNSLLGLDLTVKPIPGLRFDAAVYVDDLSFNDIIKFRKDIRARLAGEFGVAYTMPQEHWFKSASFDYTFITPYAYTHTPTYIGTREGLKGPNYSNYTHCGNNLGSNLPPNSDRFNLEVQFEPLDSLYINIGNTFIRHGNATESVTDPRFLAKYMTEVYNTDGTALNHASIDSRDYTGDHDRCDLFLHENPFMRQKTIEYINQLSVDIKTTLPILKHGGYLQAYFGYCFEADINPGVTKSIYYISDTSKKWNGVIVDKLKNGSASYGPAPADKVTTAEIMTEAQRQLDIWRDNARGKKFNHYIKLGITFSY